MCEIQGGGPGFGSWMASILFGVLLVTRNEFRSPPFAGCLLGCLGLLGGGVDGELDVDIWTRDGHLVEDSSHLMTTGCDRWRETDLNINTETKRYLKEVT